MTFLVVRQRTSTGECSLANVASIYSQSSSGRYFVIDRGKTYSNKNGIKLHMKKHTSKPKLFPQMLIGEV